MEHLKAVTIKQFRELKTEPPTADRMERLIRSACTAYEQSLFAEIMQRLSPMTRTVLDDLLASSTAQAEQEEQLHDDELTRAASQERQFPITWQDLKTNPGAVGLESVLYEIDKVRVYVTDSTSIDRSKATPTDEERRPTSTDPTHLQPCDSLWDVST